MIHKLKNSKQLWKCLSETFCQKVAGFLIHIVNFTERNLLQRWKIEKESGIFNFDFRFTKLEDLFKPQFRTSNFVFKKREQILFNRVWSKWRQMKLETSFCWRRIRGKWSLKMIYIVRSTHRGPKLGQHTVQALKQAKRSN